METLDYLNQHVYHQNSTHIQPNQFQLNLEMFSMKIIEKRST